MSEQMSDYQNIIAVSRYARWLDEEGRRETWDETADRLLSFYQKFITEKHGVSISPEVYPELYTAIRTLNVMPSMRAMMTAGPRTGTQSHSCLQLCLSSD